MADETVSRTCTECKTSKPLTAEYFLLSSKNTDGSYRFRRVCRPCGNALARERDRALKHGGLPCPYCGMPNPRRSKYCSSVCRISQTLGGLGKRYGRLTSRAVVADTHAGKRYSVRCRCDCGKEALVWAGNLIAGNVQSCGCLLKEYLTQRIFGAGAPNWRGGRAIKKNGYVYRYMPDHPNAIKNSGTSQRPTIVAEHTLVMAEYLGRPLLPGETAHHKNGNRSDNRIENLELWAVPQPAGQRVVDLVAFAKEILALYEPELPKLAALST